MVPLLVRCYLSRAFARISCARRAPPKKCRHVKKVQEVSQSIISVLLAGSRLVYYLLTKFPIGLGQINGRTLFNLDATRATEFAQHLCQ